MSRREFVAAVGSAPLATSLPVSAAPHPAALAVNPAVLTGRAGGWPLAELAATGFRAIEAPVAALERPDAWRPEMERAGLSLLGVDAMPELRPYLTGNLHDGVAWRRRDTIDRLKRAMERMPAFGARFLVVAPGRLAENYQTPAEARALLVDALREIAGAGPAEVLLCSAPFRLFGGAGEIASIVEEAARPNVAAALDLGHALLAGENPAAAARALGARLRYVQLHDADVRPGAPRLDRHLVPGTGALRREEALDAIGDRPVCVNVAAPEDPLTAARAALEWLSAPQG